jgi:lipopolysaccharide export LptBFGC system permease protein LptF
VAAAAWNAGPRELALNIKQKKKKIYGGFDAQLTYLLEFHRHFFQGFYCLFFLNPRGVT